MKEAAAGLEHRGIFLPNTLALVIQLQLGLYRSTGDQRYLENVVLKIWVYLESGFLYSRHEELFNEILNFSELSKECFFSGIDICSRKVKLTRTQIRSMIRRWTSSKYHTMPIQEVIEDIIEKVSSHRVGVYTFHSLVSSKSRYADDMYELVITDEESYFYDVRMGKCYCFHEG